MIEDTNYRNEFIAAETGGIKLHYCNDGLVKGNYVRNTVGRGFRRNLDGLGKPGNPRHPECAGEQ